MSDPKEIERLLNKALNKVIPWNGFDRQSFEVEGLLREAIRQVGEFGDGGGPSQAEDAGQGLGGLHERGGEAPEEG